MRIHKLLSCLLVSALVIFGAAAANAQATGQIWQNDTSDTADVSIASLAGLPTAKFLTFNANYNSSVTGYTPALFLNSPTFFSTANGFSATASLDNSHVLIIGGVLLAKGANNFDVAHDDGVNISFGALGGVDNPGPTAQITDSFTITAPSAGVYSAVLNYNECCGPPAVLEWTYATGAPVTFVPEPCTILLMGTGLAGLAAYRRLKKFKKV
jgi:hypothetical protein